MLGRSGRTRALTLVMGLVATATIAGVAGVAVGNRRGRRPEPRHAVDRHRR